MTEDEITLKKNNFKLGSVKVNKNGGLSLTYELQESAGAEIFNEQETKTSSKIPHPDLSSLLKGLVPTVARVFGYTPLRDAVKNKALEEAFNEVVKNLKVTGVSLSGVKENAGLIITATLKAQSNQKMAINTHRMRFVDNNYGFEAELEGVTDALNDECFAYLFEGKKAQMELFDQAAQSNEPDSDKQ